jgi:hypothetical protein
VRLWEPYFHHRGNFQAKSIVLPVQNLPRYHEIVIYAHQSLYRKQLPFYFTSVGTTQAFPDISWDCKLWSKLGLSTEVWNAVSCSFWVQDSLEEEISRWRHSTGTYFRLNLMLRYLKMTFVLKVTMILKRTHCWHWLPLQNLDFLHRWYCTCEMYLVLICYCSRRSWPKSQTERLLV